MKIICSVCGKDIEIDTPTGAAYVTEKDGKIHHNYDCMIKPDAPAGV